MMRQLFLVCGLLLAVGASPAAPATNSYIVKLKAQVSQAAFASKLNSFNRNSALPVNKVKVHYQPSFFNGVAGTFSQDFLDHIKDDVEYVELNGVMHAIGNGEQPGPPSWGQTRVSERALDLTKSYVYPSKAGEGVTVWVVDTGVNDAQSDFEGRAKMVKSFVTGAAENDGNGHGTHCSGTIASKTYGIAKKATLRGVQVLDGQGQGTYDAVISGIQYVTQNAVKGKTVMSMSLGGPKAQSVDDAIVAAIKAGVVAVVAAGNDGGDACNVSPAGAPGVLAVGATDNRDAQASFSNRGKCVGIYAPGVNIKSLWKGADGATNTISGTSMATPHVAGVAALFMAEKDYSSAEEVYADLKAAATLDVISGLDANSPNKLLYNFNTSDGNRPGGGNPPPPPPPPSDPKCPEGIPPEWCAIICKMYPEMCQ